MEFSKLLLFILLFIFVSTLIFTSVMIFITHDLSPLSVIVPAIEALLSIAVGFYYWKAKAENVIKLSGRKKLDPDDLKDIN